MLDDFHRLGRVDLAQLTGGIEAVALEVVVTVGAGLQSIRDNSRGGLAAPAGIMLRSALFCAGVGAWQVGDGWV